jgi:hypothetical protein
VSCTRPGLCSTPDTEFGTVIIKFTILSGTLLCLGQCDSFPLSTGGIGV